MKTVKKEYELGPLDQLHIPMPFTSAEDTECPTCHMWVHPQNESTAEIGGSEVPSTEAGPLLLANRGQVVSLLTPGGAQVVLEGNPKVLDDVVHSRGSSFQNEIVMPLHHFLEDCRKQARQQGLDGVGPRTLFCSALSSVGTSTLCRQLANYCCRLGYHPQLIDMCVGNPSVGIPECVSLYALQVPLDAEEGSTFTPGVHVCYGSSDPHQNSALWTACVRSTMKTAIRRAARADRCRIGGMFVDYPQIDPFLVESFESSMLSTGDATHAPTTVPPNPLDQLLTTVAECEIDTVVTVGSDWLLFKLAQWAAHKGGVLTVQDTSSTHSVVVSFPALSFRIIVVPACGLCPPPPPTLAVDLSRKQRWLEYFFGTPSSPLRPQLLQVAPSDCKFAQAGIIDASSMQGLLPLDDDRAVDPTSISFLQLGDVPLVGRVLAVSSAFFMRSSDDGSSIDVPFSEFEKELKRMSVLGFVLVREVVTEGPKKMISLLSSIPALPVAKGVCFLLTTAVLSKGR